MTKHIKFTIGGFFDGYKTVEISIGTKNVSYKILRNGLKDVDKKLSRAVEVSGKWIAEFDALNIFSWQKDYSNKDILDGTQWELIYKHGKKSYVGYGSNAYPENFEQFLDWLDELIPEMNFINRKQLEKVTLNYSEEKLTLDRRAKTLTLDKKNSRHVYNLGEDTEEVFDTCQSFFDVIELEDTDLNISSRIKIELVHHDGSTKIFETPYNENFLPGVTNFIEKIHACAGDLTAEIFSPSAVEVAPAQGKYIFCKVQFKDSYKHYTYSTDDETLAVGDVVDVPVGKNNDVNQARIVDIGYFDEYETPFPIERIKKIIGKHVADDWEQC